MRVRLGAVAAGVLMWWLLISLDRLVLEIDRPVGPFGALALLLLVVVGFLTPHSSRLQGWILRERRMNATLTKWFRIVGGIAAGVLLAAGLDLLGLWSTIAEALVP